MYRYVRIFVANKTRLSLLSRRVLTCILTCCMCIYTEDGRLVLHGTAERTPFRLLASETSGTSARRHQLEVGFHLVFQKIHRWPSRTTWTRPADEVTPIQITPHTGCWDEVLLRAIKRLDTTATSYRSLPEEVICECPSCG